MGTKFYLVFDIVDIMYEIMNRVIPIYFKLSGFTLCTINSSKDRAATPHSILPIPCKLQMPIEEQFYGWRVLKSIVRIRCLFDIEVSFV